MLKSNNQNLKENAQNAGSEILSMMKMQIDELNLNEFYHRMKEWNTLNNFEINNFQNKNRIKYIVKHDLGLLWSQFQCEMYSHILKQLNQTVLEQNLNEFSFTIEISNHDQ